MNGKPLSSTTTGHYEYRVMPFGLAIVHLLFNPSLTTSSEICSTNSVIVYIDDILIYSKTLEEHIHQVRSVLRRLITHQLYAKLEKCEFPHHFSAFLGYIISPEGIAMDDNKVNAVINWPRPRTSRNCSASWASPTSTRRFIRGFSSVAAPLTSMTKRSSHRLHWTPPLWRLSTSSASLHHCAHPAPPRPRFALHRGSRCFQHWYWCRPLTTSGVSH